MRFEVIVMASEDAAYRVDKGSFYPLLKGIPKTIVTYGAGNGGTIELISYNPNTVFTKKGDVSNIDIRRSTISDFGSHHGTFTEIFLQSTATNKTITLDRVDCPKTSLNGVKILSARWSNIPEVIITTNTDTYGSTIKGVENNARISANTTLTGEKPAKLNINRDKPSEFMRTNYDLFTGNRISQDANLDTYSLEVDFIASTPTTQKRELKLIDDFNKAINPSKVFEMDFVLKETSEIKRKVDLPDNFDKITDNSKTFEMDLSLADNAPTIRSISLDDTFNKSANTAQYTFEMDIINPYTEA